jgi:hypothetical protein
MSLEEELSRLYDNIQRARLFADELHRFGTIKDSKRTLFMHTLMENVEQQYERLYVIARGLLMHEKHISEEGAPVTAPECC